jgi:pyrroline-5-carboxylate reductase
MPNTPMLVGAGMAGICRGRFATEPDLLQVERIFSSGGGSKTVRVPETQMNAVTALSGSGPAYLFFLTEALAAAGEKLGLSAADAALLARQTVIGSAELLGKSKDGPAELRRKVTSPGGTTQAAIEAFQAGSFGDLVTKALQAAERRAGELSK